MINKILSSVIAFAFMVNCLGPIPNVKAAVVNLPAPGVMVNLSPAYEPVLIKGLTVNKDNPFLFDFVVDTGNNTSLKQDELKAESDRLIKYFFASLTVPEKDLWVNLSPYEKDKMIPDALGQTALGRDLLAQDYILKQLTASLIYPEKSLGKEFWNRVYQKAQERFGTSEVPVNTFNKVWILADKATVYEQGQTAFVVDGHLKVMLESDFLAMSKSASSGWREGGDPHRAQLKTSTMGTPQRQDPLAADVSNQIIRDVIIPELEREVNTGKNFALLRQIFNSLILASWYKKNLKESLINQVYANKNTVKGVNLNDPTVNENIYQQYLAAYKKGVFNFIKEDYSNGQLTPRKYFSGGFGVNQQNLVNVVRNDPAMASSLAKTFKSALFGVAIALAVNQPDNVQAQKDSWSKDDWTTDTTHPLNPQNPLSPLNPNGVYSIDDNSSSGKNENTQWVEPDINIVNLAFNLALEVGKRGNLQTASNILNGVIAQSNRGIIDIEKIKFNAWHNADQLDKLTRDFQALKQQSAVELNKLRDLASTNLPATDIAFPKVASNLPSEARVYQGLFNIATNLAHSDMSNAHLILRRLTDAADQKINQINQSEFKSFLESIRDNARTKMLEIQQLRKNKQSQGTNTTSLVFSNNVVAAKDSTNNAVLKVNPSQDTMLTVMQWGAGSMMVLCGIFALKIISDSIKEGGNGIDSAMTSSLNKTLKSALFGAAVGLAVNQSNAAQGVDQSKIDENTQPTLVHTNNVNEQQRATENTKKYIENNKWRFRLIGGIGILAAIWGFNKLTKHEYDEKSPDIPGDNAMLVKINSSVEIDPLDPLVSRLSGQVTDFSDFAALLIAEGISSTQQLTRLVKDDIKADEIALILKKEPGINLGIKLKVSQFKEIFRRVAMNNLEKVESIFAFYLSKQAAAVFKRDFRITTREELPLSFIKALQVRLLNNPSVLILDPEEEEGMAHGIALSIQKYARIKIDIVIAKSPQDALTKLKVGKFSWALISLDYQQPGVLNGLQKGLEIAQDISRINGDLPIIITSLDKPSIRGVIPPNTAFLDKHYILENMRRVFADPAMQAVQPSHERIVLVIDMLKELRKLNDNGIGETAAVEYVPTAVNLAKDYLEGKRDIKSILVETKQLLGSQQAAQWFLDAAYLTAVFPGYEKEKFRFLRAHLTNILPPIDPVARAAQAMNNAAGISSISEAKLIADLAVQLSLRWQIAQQDKAMTLNEPIDIIYDKQEIENLIDRTSATKSSVGGTGEVIDENVIQQKLAMQRLYDLLAKGAIDKKVLKEVMGEEDVAFDSKQPVGYRWVNLTSMPYLASDRNKFGSITINGIEFKDRRSMARELAKEIRAYISNDKAMTSSNLDVKAIKNIKAGEVVQLWAKGKQVGVNEFEWLPRWARIEQRKKDPADRWSNIVVELVFYQSADTSVKVGVPYLLNELDVTTEPQKQAFVDVYAYGPLMVMLKKNVATDNVAKMSFIMAASPNEAGPQAWQFVDGLPSIDGVSGLDQKAFINGILLFKEWGEGKQIDLSALLNQRYGLRKSSGESGIIVNQDPLRIHIIDFIHQRQVEIKDLPGFLKQRGVLLNPRVNPVMIASNLEAAPAEGYEYIFENGAIKTGRIISKQEVGSENKWYYVAIGLENTTKAEYWVSLSDNKVLIFSKTMASEEIIAAGVVKTLNFYNILNKAIKQVIVSDKTEYTNGVLSVSKFLVPAEISRALNIPSESQPSFIRVLTKFLTAEGLLVYTAVNGKLRGDFPMQLSGQEAVINVAGGDISLNQIIKIKSNGHVVYVSSSGKAEGAAQIIKAMKTSVIPKSGSELELIMTNDKAMTSAHLKSKERISLSILTDETLTVIVDAGNGNKTENTFTIADGLMKDEFGQPFKLERGKFILGHEFSKDTQIVVRYKGEGRVVIENNATGTYDVQYSISPTPITEYPEGNASTFNNGSFPVDTDGSHNDEAMIGKNITPGGIDLNLANMGLRITKDANGGVKVNFDPALIERIKQQGVQSVVPVIINITPITSVLPLLGLSPAI